jgi:predicted Zn-dependent protease
MTPAATWIGGLEEAKGDPVKIAGWVPIGLLEGKPMKALHPPRPWVILLVWMAAFLLPSTARGRSPDALLPDGVCGNSQTMLEASRAGDAIVHQVLAVSMPWGDKALNEYINRLGQNLARSSGSQQVFSFYVVYNPQVNAQSFPGGNIVINTGVISLAGSEAELASVLSHEIAHENSCDWRSTPQKGNLFELIFLVPTIVFGGPAGMAIAAGGGWAGTLARARSSRSMEQRADHLAAEYLVRAGYDPHAAALFFQRLQVEMEQTGGEPGGLLATHPRAFDREKKLEEVIPNLPPPVFEAHDEAEFLRMRQAVREYDDMYSRLVGVHVPGQEAPSPELSRRPASLAPQ